MRGFAARFAADSAGPGQGRGSCEQPCWAAGGRWPGSRGAVRWHWVQGRELALAQSCRHSTSSPLPLWAGTAAGRAVRGAALRGGCTWCSLWAPSALCWGTAAGQACVLPALHCPCVLPAPCWAREGLLCCPEGPALPMGISVLWSDLLQSPSPEYVGAQLRAVGAGGSSPPRHVAALGAPAAVGRVPAASCSPTTRWAVGLSDGAAQLCLPHRGQNERGAISTASLRVRVCAEDSSCGCEVGGGSSRCGVGAVSAGLHSTAGCSEHRCLSLQVLSEQTDLRRWLWVVRLHTRTHGLPGEHTGMWLQLCMFRGVGGAGWGQCPAVPAALSCRTDGKRWRLLQIIHTDSNTVLGQNDTGFSCDGSSNTFRVMFKEPVEVLPNVNYTACATLKVPSWGAESRGG